MGWALSTNNLYIYVYITTPSQILYMCIYKYQCLYTGEKTSHMYLMMHHTCPRKLWYMYLLMFLWTYCFQGLWKPFWSQLLRNVVHWEDGFHITIGDNSPIQQTLRCITWYSCEAHSETIINHTVLKHFWLTDGDKCAG